MSFLYAEYVQVYLPIYARFACVDRLCMPVYTHVHKHGAFMCVNVCCVHVYMQCI